jgi:hypothetical protein
MKISTKAFCGAGCALIQSADATLDHLLDGHQWNDDGSTPGNGLV